jgi:glutamine amidotransferase
MRALLIDYERGNLRSVEKALQQVGMDVERGSDPRAFKGPDLVVLPGVGAFGDAMRNLQSKDLVEPIRDWLGAGRPFLGICLGFQLLFESSEESPDEPGLGWVPGRVVRFSAMVGKVPHMGWNEVVAEPRPEGTLAAFDGPAYFYHVHSYYPVDVPADVVAGRTEYGVKFVSAIEKGNAFACQFHPEKSQENGLKLLDSFRERIAGASVT